VLWLLSQLPRRDWPLGLSRRFKEAGGVCLGVAVGAVISGTWMPELLPRFWSSPLWVVVGVTFAVSREPRLTSDSFHSPRRCRSLRHRTKKMATEATFCSTCPPWRKPFSTLVSLTNIVIPKKRGRVNWCRPSISHHFSLCVLEYAETTPALHWDQFSICLDLRLTSYFCSDCGLGGSWSVWDSFGQDVLHVNATGRGTLSYTEFLLLQDHSEGPWLLLWRRNNLMRVF
jgi:hypothetical protein